MAAATTRSAVLKILIASIASTAAILLLSDLASTAVGSTRCDSSLPAPIAGSTELDSAFRTLISLGWLAANDRAVFVGPDSISAAMIARQIGLSAALAASTTACCALPFDAESFDFAFSAALDRARVPARVVLEMERVLRPGRVGAIFRRRRGSGGLMRAAAPVASLLRFSDVVGARALNGSAIVVFRKHRLRGGETERWSGGDGGDSPCAERITMLPLVLGDAIERVRRAAIVIGTGRFGISIDLFGG